MRVGFILLVLVLGSIQAATAQTQELGEVPPPPAESSLVLTAPMLTIPNDQPPALVPLEQSDRGPGVSAGRVALEILGAGAGMLTAAGVTLAAAIVYASVDDYPDEDDDCDPCILSDSGAAFLVGTFIVADFVAVPLGVYLLGEARHGDGSYWTTFVGHLAGLLPAWGLASVDEDLAAPAFLALPVIGAILGYELSSDDNWQPDDNDNVTPSVSVSADGVSLGVAGRF